MAFVNTANRPGAIGLNWADETFSHHPEKDPFCSLLPLKLRAEPRHLDRGMGPPRRRHRRDAGVRPARLCTRAHPELRENTLWSLGWIGIALAFGAFFWAWQGSEAGSQYLAGYLLERSLSLDNIFVFAVILTYFAVPGLQVQAKVLAWGIVLALCSGCVHHRSVPRCSTPST